MKRVLTEVEEIERSIIKRFRKEIWSKFVKAIKDYELVQEGDKILVCISGGKDSFLLAKCFQELKRHSKFEFDVKFAVMNPGYKEANKQMILKNSERLNIPIEMFDSDVFAVAEKLNSESPCYMCARMRRGFLYAKAQELGCNKIALGHHFNDVIETTLLSMFYGSEIKTMMPKLHSDNFKGIELIRPLFYVHEDDIISWKKYNNLEFLNCACKFTEKSEIDEDASKRRVMKRLIKELKSDNKNVDNNIFKALDNVNLNCVLGYKKENVYTSFLDDYDEREK